MSMKMEVCNAWKMVCGIILYINQVCRITSTTQQTIIYDPDKYHIYIYTQMFHTEDYAILSDNKTPTRCI